jgi:hypothetical protein
LRFGRWLGEMLYILYRCKYCANQNWVGEERISLSKDRPLAINVL